MNEHDNPSQKRPEKNVMGFKNVAEPTNIGRVQQGIDGVGDENKGNRNPDDIEAAARIMRRTVEPIFVHYVSPRRFLQPVESSNS